MPPRAIKRQGFVPASAPLCRQRWGQNLALIPHTLLLGDGPTGLGPHPAEVPLTTASQRFYHILHVAASAGEHEKVVQVMMLWGRFWGLPVGQYLAVCLSPDSGWETLQMVSGKQDRCQGWWTWGIGEISQR